MGAFAINIKEVFDSGKMDEFQDAMNEVQDAWVREIESIANEFGISFGSAGEVWYLRSRGRWTKAKEEKLIELGKAGKCVNMCEWDGEDVD
jgi:hypothetical protein